MKIQDFQFMWRGSNVRNFEEDETSLLLPIDIKRPGNDRAILLLHGFSSAPSVFNEIINYMPMYNAIYGPVLPGHATSIEHFSKSSAQNWLDEAIASYLTLCNKYKKVDVMGLSLGGLLACKIAEIYPINHLYLLAPALKLHGFIAFRLWLIKLLNLFGVKKIPNQSGNFYSIGPENLTYKYLPLSAVKEILTLVNNYNFSEFNCTTDLFLGLHDDVVDSNAVAKLFYNQKNVTIHWLNKSAHILPLDGDISKIINTLS